MKSYLALVICSMLAMQAVSMNGDDEDQVLPGPRCITEACGKFIIINGQVVPNTNGECQKNKPADAWYAMQNQSLCHRAQAPCDINFGFALRTKHQQVCFSGILHWCLAQLGH